MVVAAGEAVTGIEASLAKTGSIAGVVTDSAGSPLEGIYISAYRDGVYSSGANTAADGSYRIAGLPAGGYTVQFQDWSGAYVGEWFDDVTDLGLATEVVVAAGEAVVGVDASLATGGSIAGVVTDSAGLPLEGIYVSRSPSGQGTYTAADGTYRLTGLSVGSYSVRFEDFEGIYLAQWFDDVADQGTATEVVVAAGEAVVGVDASLATGGSIAGVVTDSAGAPLEGIYAWVYRDGSGRGASTASDGSYRVSGLEAGTYTVQFQDSSGAYLGEWFDDVADQGTATEVVVAAGEAVVGVDASLTTGGSIAGVLTDSAGSPLEGIYVYSVPGYRYAYTAADGSYRIAGVPAGSYQVRFNGSGAYVGEWFDDVADQGSATEVVVAEGEAVVGVDASLTTGGSIAGVLTDSAGSPLEGIYVYSVPGYRYAYTAADGSYRIAGVPAGSYQVRFNGSGAYVGEWFDDVADQGSATEVVVAEGEAVVGVDASLATAGSIIALVADPDGQPVEGANTYLYRNGLYVASDVSDSEGRAVHQGLDAGEYQLYVTDPSGDHLPEWHENADTASDATPLTVAFGQVVEVDVSLARASHITGTLTTSDGTPVAGVSVRALRTRDEFDHV